MNIQDKMRMTAAEIKERLVSGQPVSKGDMRFMESYLNMDTRKACNAGKQWGSKKSGVNR